MNKKIVGLTVSCLMVVALLLTACAPAVPKEKEVAPKEVAPKEVVPIEEEKITPAAELPRVSIGETARGMGIAVTISKTIVTDSYQYSSLTSGEMVTQTARPGMSFLIATVEVKNVGTTTRKAGAGMARAFDAEGLDYAALPYYGENPFPLDKYLPEGQELRGKALFEIRKGASGLGIRWTGVGVWEIK